MYLRFSSTMHAGHGDRQRYIPVPDISDKLGVALCGSLPACHALTGCDTTSSLLRIGKTTAFNKTALCRGANLRLVHALVAIYYRLVHKQSTQVLRLVLGIWVCDDTCWLMVTSPRTLLPHWLKALPLYCQPHTDRQHPLLSAGYRQPDRDSTDRSTCVLCWRK